MASSLISHRAWKTHSLITVFFIPCLPKVCMCMCAQKTRSCFEFLHVPSYSSIIWRFLASSSYLMKSLQDLLWKVGALSYDHFLLCALFNAKNIDLVASFTSLHNNRLCLYSDFILSLFSVLNYMLDDIDRNLYILLFLAFIAVQSVDNMH